MRNQPEPNPTHHHHHYWWPNLKVKRVRGRGHASRINSKAQDNNEGEIRRPEIPLQFAQLA